MSDRPMFSIITPTKDRAHSGKLQRCLHSARGQTFRDFEHIVVDDGSTDNTQEVLKKEGEINNRLKVVTLKENRGRVIARNIGMETAKGKWFCWLDSDDAYDLEYLNTFQYYINKERKEGEEEHHVWICGAIVHGMNKRNGMHICPRWTKFRRAWRPPVDSDGYHKHFNSGHIGTGMFVYSREAFNRVGLLPEWRTPYDIADGVNEWLEYDTPYSAAEQWVGNPYGDDWAYIRRLTQFYRVRLIPEACLYVQYVR